MQEKILIYQVLPRLYGNKVCNNRAGGTLAENGCGKMNDFTDSELKRIADYGFTHIWYTGLIEHATQTDYSEFNIAQDHPAVVKGVAGSPYAIKDYYDIDPDLAVNVKRRMKEFEALVARTHAAGLKFIIDFVPNHVARQYKSDAKPARVKDLGEDDDNSRHFAPNNNFYYICESPLCKGWMSQAGNDEYKPYKEYPAKATGNDVFSAQPGENDWYETVKLNYGVDYLGGHRCHFNPIPDTWKKMTNILLFWAKKGVDAFRCDMAEMVPCEFWTYAIAEVKKKYPHICFIAEVYNPTEYRNYIRRGGFDYLYDKVGLYDTLRAVICGYAPASAITHAWQSVDDIHEHMLNFLENHDEQRIASDFFAGDARKALPALVVSACMRSNPFMVYAGQELGERGMDAEGFSGTDGRTTIFDYWGVMSLQRMSLGEIYLRPEEQYIYGYYRRILNLCQRESALNQGVFYDLTYANLDHTGDFNPDRHYAFIRKHDNETLLICANFSDESRAFGVRIPAHAFEFLNLRSGAQIATDLIGGEIQSLELRPDAHTSIYVPAQGAVILKIK